jgi:hypothetical protein
MSRGRYLLASLSLVFLMVAASKSQTLERSSSIVSRREFRPHFVQRPTLTLDCGALLLQGSIADLDRAPVAISVSATVLSSCTNSADPESHGITIEQTATATRPYATPVNGQLDFAIRTEPLEDPCSGAMAAPTDVRDFMIVVYRGDEILLQTMFDGATAR